MPLTQTRVPKTLFKIMTPEGPASISTEKIFSGKSVVLFAVTGAFTPASHFVHLPGFLDEIENFRKHSIDTIACTSTNDIFVLDEWARVSGADSKIMFLADGNADFCDALNLKHDARELGFGLRSKQYAMWVLDGVIQYIGIEDEASEMDASSAVSILQMLGNYESGALPS